MAKKTGSKKTEAASTLSKSKPLPTGLKIVIGCVGILVIIGILIGVTGQVIFSKMGVNFMKKGIEKKTGISMDTAGKNMTIKDDTTGAEINIGTEGKIPADFPKDFPIYPGVKVEGNISGAENKAGKGFWLILSTTDGAAKVTAFYETNLAKNGWEIGSTMNIGTSATWEISKGDMSGGLIVGEDEEKTGASIVITLSPKEEMSSEE